MDRNAKIGVGIAGGAAAVMAAAILGFSAGSALMANAADSVPAAAISAAAISAAEMPAAAASASASPERGGGGWRGGPGETPLTGAAAEKATAAAKAAVADGTVIRVETDAQGTYEAHVTKADGTEVVVLMDKDFNVTSVEEFPGRPGGIRGHHETPLTGTDAEKATAAAKAAVADGTVIRVETDSQGTYEAHMTKADGTEVVVLMDKDFNVTSVEAFTGRPGGMRGHHGHGSHGAGTVPTPSSSTA